MSRSSCVLPQPTVAVAAPATPRTFRKSRRRTPVEFGVSLIQIVLVVTDAAIVADLVLHVTVDTPPHAEWRVLVDARHGLYWAMAVLALHASVDVGHVGEVDVVRHLVDADPRHRLLGGPIRGELGDSFALACGAGGTRRPVGTDNGVAPHAGAHRGEPRVGRLECREVTVDAVQAERLHVHRVREVDRLDGCTALGSRAAPVSPRFVGGLLGELRGALRGSEKLPL